MKRIFCVLILALCLGLLINAAVPAISFAGPETAIANAVVAQAPAQRRPQQRPTSPSPWGCSYSLS